MTYMWRSENNLEESVSPSTMLVQGIELRSSGLFQVPLAMELSRGLFPPAPHAGIKPGAVI